MMAGVADEELTRMKSSPSYYEDIGAQHDRAASRALLANVCYGAAVAAAATGAVIVLLGDGREESGRVHVVPLPVGLGLALRGAVP